MLKILPIFGTRPEVIKLAPVITAARRDHRFTVVTVSSGQHGDLLHSFTTLFGIRVDLDLGIMRRDQNPAGVCARLLTRLDPLLASQEPDVVVVQGDTTTALAGALAAFHRHIPVAHVEAGLRSGDPHSPFPEEMNRRVISQLASIHLAATDRNRATLIEEGVPEASIVVTGNPVVDAVVQMLASNRPTPVVDELRQRTGGRRLIVLTTHRRESFGTPMLENLRVIRQFVDRHEDAAVVFPVHPNPRVVEASAAVLEGHPRIHLIQPLDYPDFLGLLSEAWLIVSDSGGVQEEAPTLGKPVLILRDNTERPEGVDAGVARLVGGNPARLAVMLEEAIAPGAWTENVGRIPNPFGRGDSGPRILDALADALGERTASPQTSELSRAMTSTP